MTGVDARGPGRHPGPHAHDAAAPGIASPPSASSPSVGHALAGRLLIPVIPAILGLITGGYHLGVPPLWRDEAATKAIAGRPAGQILAAMAHDDVVHCAYYLVVHVTIGLFGSSNGALRLPSVIATSVACAFTALVAKRLAGGGGRWYAGLTGVTAGAVLAVLPAAIRYAQEARSYAIVTMLATIATYLLLRAVDDGRRRWWTGYGIAVFLTGLFNILGLLIVVAHGLTLLAAGCRRTEHGTERRRTGHAVPAGGRRLLAVPLGWLAAGVGAAVLLVPLVLAAYAQRNALGWMTGTADIRLDVVALAHVWAGSSSLAWPVSGLAALGVAAGLIAGRRSLSPATVALPWLVAPSAILLVVSLTHSVYDQRYVQFCLPALAICVASGITWLWRLAAAALTRIIPGQLTRDRLTRGQTAPGRSMVGWLACLPAVAVAVALAVALQPADAVVRQPGYRPDNLELESHIIAANAKPGDIVFFIPINDRIVSMPFPGPWQKLRDIALATTPVASNTLYGTDVSPAELLKRFTHLTRVWVISSSEVTEAAYLASPQATPLDREEFRLTGAMRQVHRWRDGDTDLTLYAAR
jgi:mannosyltransferase